MNKAYLLGNLCKDPEIKTFDNGGKIANLSMATNKRGYKTKEGKEIPERTEFHNLVINSAGLVDVAAKFLHKGDKILVSGEIRNRSYEDNSGVKRYVTEIHVDTLEMCGGKPKEAEQAAQVQQASPQVDDDLPF